MGWDQVQGLPLQEQGRVSIPRSGFCGVGHHTLIRVLSGGFGFNPSVGILWGGTWGLVAGTLPYPYGFNPSVGILWGGTAVGSPREEESDRFQSLGRDSVGWDWGRRSPA